MYLDANNLYGWAMSQPLTDDDYEWVSDDECRDACAALQNKASRDLWYYQENHYIFEVDMDYPPELHERDDDYPLAPETMTIGAEITDEKQHQLRAKYFEAACPLSRTLEYLFLPTRKYVVHGHLLRFYLDRGMKLVRVHRAIRFTASPDFEPYINNKTQKRRQCKTDEVARNFYKLMNNASQCKGTKIYPVKMYSTMYPKIYPVKNKPYGLFFTGYIFGYIVGYIFTGYIFVPLH